MRTQQNTNQGHGHARHALWWYGFVVLGVLVSIGWPPSMSYAAKVTQQACQSWSKQNQFSQAAECYLSLYRSVDKRAEWKQDAALYKDRFLRQAALGYLQASRQVTELGKQNYLKTQAVRWLRYSFQKGYCEAADRCRSNGLLANRIDKSIQRTPLTVVTSNRRARITVTGYKYKVSRFQRFNSTLSPGRYTVSIAIPGKQVQTKAFTLRPSHPIVLNASAAKIVIREKRILVAKKIPPLVVSGYVVGSAMLVAGAVMLAYGVMEQGRLNGIISDPEKNKSITDGEFNDGFYQAEAFKVVGGVTGGTGISLVIGGVIAHVSANAASQKKPPAPPMKAQRLASNTQAILWVGEP